MPDGPAKWSGNVVVNAKRPDLRSLSVRIFIGFDNVFGGEQ